MFRKLCFSAALIAFSVTANAIPIFQEGFDSRASLGAAGWLFGNFSGAAPTYDGADWFQGNTGIFEAQAGGADSYVANNYLSADFGGNIDSWLVTPEIAVEAGNTFLSFSTRSAGSVPGDTLQLLYNDTGSLFLSDFVSLGFISSYPTDWQTFDFTYAGATANARFAFRYLVTDTSVNGDYIGIDSVKVSVPEPGTLMLLGAGLLLMPLTKRRRRRDPV